MWHLMQQFLLVYSKPNCVQCTMTYRTLDRAGVSYDVVDLTENAAAYEYVTGDLGYSAAPVVVISEHDHWAGFHPDNLARAIANTERGGDGE